MFITTNTIIGYSIDLVAVEFQQTSIVDQLKDSNDAFILMQKSRSIINKVTFISYMFINLILLYIADMILKIRKYISK